MNEQRVYYRSIIALRKEIVAVMLTLVFVLVTFLSVSAATGEDLISNFVRDNAPVSDVAGVARTGTEQWNSVASYFSESVGDRQATASSGGKSKTWYYSSTDEQAILNAAGLNASISETNQRIDEMTGNLNIQADTAGAANMLSGVIPIVNVVVGVVVVLVVVLLGLYTGFDIMFLAFPVFRSFCQEKLDSGNTGAMVKKTSGGENKYRFISDDAVRAYQQTIVEGNKQPYIKYAVSRAWAYIALAIIVVVLLTGNYSVFLKIGIKIGEGIINIVNSVGKV